LNEKNEEQSQEKPETVTEESRFPELDELQAEIQKRIHDNERFLERFLDENHQDEDEIDEGEIDEGEEDEGSFEEL